jgi:hypothetical protein
VIHKVAMPTATSSTVNRERETARRRARLRAATVHHILLLWVQFIMSDVLGQSAPDHLSISGAKRLSDVQSSSSSRPCLCSDENEEHKMGRANLETLLETYQYMTRRAKQQEGKKEIQQKTSPPLEPLFGPKWQVLWEGRCQSSKRRLGEALRHRRTDENTL